MKAGMSITDVIFIRMTSSNQDIFSGHVIRITAWFCFFSSVSSFERKKIRGWVIQVRGFLHVTVDHHQFNLSRCVLLRGKKCEKTTNKKTATGRFPNLLCVIDGWNQPATDGERQTTQPITGRVVFARLVFRVFQQWIPRHHWSIQLHFTTKLWQLTN